MYMDILHQKYLEVQLLSYFLLSIRWFFSGIKHSKFHPLCKDSLLHGYLKAQLFSCLLLSNNLCYVLQKLYFYFFKYHFLTYIFQV